MDPSDNVRALRPPSLEPASPRHATPLLRALAHAMVAGVQTVRQARGLEPYKQHVIDVAVEASLRAAREWQTRMAPLTDYERQAFYKFAGAWLAERLAFEFVLAGDDR